jgi:hypothetical protein
MKKTLAISLILAHLFGNTEFSQVLKLPQLVSHYHSHRLKNTRLSFISFLVMHYSGDDGTREDDSEDMKLPFRSSEHSCVFFCLCRTM